MITVWPVDAVAGVPEYSGRMLRQAQSVFLPMGDSSRPLGAVSGVRAGTPTSTGSVSGTSWVCGAHAGVLDVEPAVEAGPYAYAVDAPVSGSLVAADASNARTDLVFAQLSDPAEGDGSSVPKVEVKYLAGVPAAVPAVPATPARSIPLFRVNVPKAGGGNPTTTWVAPVVGSVSRGVGSALTVGGVTGAQVGTAADSSTQFLVQFGSNVGAANSAGDGINVTFSKPFPNAVAMVVASNGDSTAAPEMVVDTVNISKTSFGVHVSARSRSVRINWIAIGW